MSDKLMILGNLAEYARGNSENVNYYSNVGQNFLRGYRNDNAGFQVHQGTMISSGSYYNQQYNYTMRPYNQFGQIGNYTLAPQVHYLPVRGYSMEPQPLPSMSSNPAAENNPVIPIGEPIKDPSEIYKELCSTLEKPSKEKVQYMCDLRNCGWTFKRKSDFLRHLKIHENPQFTCPYFFYDSVVPHKGGSVFKRKDVLKRHLRSIHFIPNRSKGTIGQCKICLEFFETEREFQGHCEDCAKRFKNCQKPQSTQSLVQRY